MDPATIAALGQVAGGVIGSLGSKKPKKPDNAVSLRNPLMNEMMVEALLALGAPISPALLERASPLGRLSDKKIGRTLITLVNQGREAGMSLDEILASIEGAGEKGDLFERAGLKEKKLSKMLAKAGYGSLRDLVSADLNFNETAKARLDKFNAIQPGVEQGRLDALSKVAGIQSDFVAPSREQILGSGQEQTNILLAALQRELNDQQSSIMEQANTAGINPAARLGRLDEFAAQQRLEAPTTGLARALQLLSGQQGLQTNALVGLQGSLSNAQQTPMNLLQLQSGNSLGLGQIAANQAMNLAGLQQQQNNNLASGISGAANSVAGWLAAQQFNQLNGGQAAAPFDTSGLDTYTGLTR